MDNERYNIPTDEFIKKVKREICNNTKTKTMIYIDLLHLINMRQCVFENSKINKYQSYIEIYNILCNLVNKGVILCPSSYATISELDKQEDYSTLINTCKIIDQLSHGISFDQLLILPSEMINIQRGINGENLGEKEEFYLCPNTCADIVFFKKNILEKILELSDKSTEEKNRIIEFCLRRTIEEQFFYRRKCLKLKTRHNTNLFASTLDKNKKQANYNEVLLYNTQSFISNLNEVFGNKIKNLTNINIETIKNYAPSIYIIGQILTIKELRTSENAKERENDFYDLYHSATALSYCDYFFTERSFHHLLTHKPFQFETKCTIESDPNIFLDLIKKLQ